MYFFACYAKFGESEIQDFFCGVEISKVMVKDFIMDTLGLVSFFFFFFDLSLVPYLVSTGMKD